MARCHLVLDRIRSVAAPQHEAYILYRHRGRIGG
jgi:hypothetical protein